MTHEQEIIISTINRGCYVIDWVRVKSVINNYFVAYNGYHNIQRSYPHLKINVDKYVNNFYRNRKFFPPQLKEDLYNKFKKIIKLNRATIWKRKVEMIKVQKKIEAEVVALEFGKDIAMKVAEYSGDILPIIGKVVAATLTVASGGLLAPLFILGSAAMGAGIKATAGSYKKNANIYSITRDFSIDITCNVIQLKASQLNSKVKSEVVGFVIGLTGEISKVMFSVKRKDLHKQVEKTLYKELTKVVAEGIAKKIISKFTKSSDLSEKLVAYVITKGGHTTIDYYYSKKTIKKKIPHHQTLKMKKKIIYKEKIITEGLILSGDNLIINRRVYHATPSDKGLLMNINKAIYEIKPEQIKSNKYKALPVRTI